MNGVSASSEPAAARGRTRPPGLPLSPVRRISEVGLAHLPKAADAAKIRASLAGFHIPRPVRPISASSSAQEDLARLIVQLEEQAAIEEEQGNIAQYLEDYEDLVETCARTCLQQYFSLSTIEEKRKIIFKNPEEIELCSEFKQEVQKLFAQRNMFFDSHSYWEVLRVLVKAYTDECPMDSHPSRLAALQAFYQN